MSRPRFDISDRRDVACLVNMFYDRVRDDELLGPIFDDVAHVDWGSPAEDVRLWDSVLFGTATFESTPLITHRTLARKTPLTDAEFNRWVALFQNTVDDLFTGTIADQAKQSGVRIASRMEHFIAVEPGIDLS